MTREGGLRTQAVRRTAESSREIFNCGDVATYGILRIIATLEILQHHFFTPLLVSSRAASAARTATCKRAKRTNRPEGETRLSFSLKGAQKELSHLRVPPRERRSTSVQNPSFGRGFEGQ